MLVKPVNVTGELLRTIEMVSPRRRLTIAVHAEVPNVYGLAGADSKRSGHGLAFNYEVRRPRLRHLYVCNVTVRSRHPRMEGEVC